MVMTDEWLAGVLGGADPIDVEVGINIRQARKAKSMSQTELADALGMSFQQVQKYERGANRVSASVLVKAAQTLGVSPMALLPPETPIDHSPSLLTRLVTIRGAYELIEAYARIPLPNAAAGRVGVSLGLGEAPPRAGARAQRGRDR